MNEITLYKDLVFSIFFVKNKMFEKEKDFVCYFCKSFKS